MHTLRLFFARIDSAFRVEVWRCFVLLLLLAVIAPDAAAGLKFDVFIKVGGRYEACDPRDYTHHLRGRSVLEVYRQAPCGTMWLYEQIPYAHGRKHGTVKRYRWIDGRRYLQKHIPYQHGVRCGITTVYDACGRVVRAVEYASSERHGWDIQFGYATHLPHGTQRFEVRRTYYRSGSVCSYGHAFSREITTTTCPPPVVYQSERRVVYEQRAVRPSPAVVYRPIETYRPPPAYARQYTTYRTPRGTRSTCGSGVGWTFGIGRY